MAVYKPHKYVSVLPATLEADSVYFVRTGAGFDLYVTNSSGTVVAYPANYVRTINGATPDTNGNINVQGADNVARDLNFVI